MKDTIYILFINSGRQKDAANRLYTEEVEGKVIKVL